MERNMKSVATSQQWIGSIILPCPRFNSKHTSLHSSLTGAKPYFVEPATTFDKLAAHLTWTKLTEQLHCKSVNPTFHCISTHH